MTAMVPPDYDHGIVNLMASLRLGLGGAPGDYAPLMRLPPVEVAAARCVVLLVIDGLGYAHLQRSGRFRDYLRDSLSSVFPSSTAPAVTSFVTGVGPQQHAITGWFMYLRELGAVTTILPFRTRPGGVALQRLKMRAATVLGAGSVFDRLDVTSHYLIGRSLVDSAYSRAVAGRARRLDYRDLETCCTAIRRLAQERGGRRFVYAYWPQLDALAHEHGVHSDAVAAHLQELETRIAALIGELRGSHTLLVVTADHGFIDTEPAQVISLEDHPELREMLALPLCGEPRAAFCYLREGQRARFEHYAATVLGDCCECRTAEELIRQGWFGRGEPHPRLAARLGDYVLLTRDRYVLTERLPDEPPWSMIGVHGGTSPEEMQVPLLVAEC